MQRFDFLGDRDWRRAVLSKAFGRSFLGFLGVAVALGLLCWALKGGAVVAHAFANDLSLLLNLMPRVVIALTIAALIWVMLPRDRMSALVGRDSGLRGLVIATLAGAVTPGGPSSAYSLLAVLAGSGADRGALIAYIVSWATLGMQRILVWDIPFMGVEFAFLRIFVSLPLPILAGLIARRLTTELRVPGGTAKP